MEGETGRKFTLFRITLSKKYDELQNTNIRHAVLIILIKLML